MMPDSGEAVPASGFGPVKALDGPSKGLITFLERLPAAAPAVLINSCSCFFNL